MEELKKKEKIRKVFLDDLPIWSKGNRATEGTINWIKSAELRCKVRFIYEDIEGYVEIIGYEPKGQYLFIKYLDKDPFKILTGNFIKCQFGRLLERKTNKFKVEIGKIFKDDKRDMIITDREYRDEYGKNNKYKRKFYKYKCNKCGFECGEHYKDGEYREELWIIESSLLGQEGGCSCCSGKVVVHDINSISNIAHWMMKFFANPEDAKKYTKQSNNTIKVRCPDCGRIRDKEMQIHHIYKTHSIGCSCGDGIPYPEKFMNMVLEQLNINFKTQLTKTTFKWCGNNRYDFYFELNDNKYIVETHGSQHYGNTFESCGGDNIEDTYENDKFKKELALQNGIKEENYIVIDSRESELEWIKNSILKSRLVELFDLSIIDWIKCEEFSLSNRVKEICELKRGNPNMTTVVIGEIMNLDRHTVLNYLKKGTKLGWCKYDPKEEMRKSGLSLNRQIEVLKDGMSLGVFESCRELSRQSYEVFGCILYSGSISEVCNGKKKHYKGFTFQYT